LASVTALALAAMLNFSFMFRLIVVFDSFLLQV
jgi:hypothetical protein